MNKEGQHPGPPRLGSGRDERSLSTQEAWIPATGRLVHQAGTHFDVVRVKGELGEKTGSRLLRVHHPTSAGPIVRNLRGDGTYYFLLSRGSADSYRWPPGIRAFTSGHEEYVEVPALTGDGHWQWFSEPADDLEFVDGGELHRMLCEITGFSPRSEAHIATGEEGICPVATAPTGRPA